MFPFYNDGSNTVYWEKNSVIKTVDLRKLRFLWSFTRCCAMSLCSGIEHTWFYTLWVFFDEENPLLSKVINNVQAIHITTISSSSLWSSSACSCSSCLCSSLFSCSFFHTTTTRRDSNAHENSCRKGFCFIELSSSLTWGFRACYLNYTKQHKLHQRNLILEAFSQITDKIFSGTANFLVKQNRWLLKRQPFSSFFCVSTKVLSMALFAVFFGTTTAFFTPQRTVHIKVPGSCNSHRTQLLPVPRDQSRSEEKKY